MNQAAEAMLAAVAMVVIFWTVWYIAVKEKKK